ncbi:hypothetical protein IKG29_02050 [Candidatus Saccharibacteria bacterium]|nr:hypothetical protein [Candidatus Saccharibacteria bacterium]
MEELISLLSSGTLGTSPDGWEYASVIIGAIGAIGLWILFTFLIKGNEKRNTGEDCKKFFMMRGNFAEDLTKIVYFYVSLKTLIVSFQLLSLQNGFWMFIKTVIGQLIWYRFVYEIIMAIVRKNSGKE